MKKWGMAVAVAAAAVVATAGPALADDAPVIDHGLINVLVQDVQAPLVQANVLPLNAPLVDLPDLPSLSLTP